MQKRKRRIGILGGSFNPPTMGHIQIAAEAINLRHVDESWIIPCGTRPDKKITTSGEKRLEMVQILVDSFFERDFPIKVNDIEIRNKEYIPTYMLIKKLQEDPKNHNYDFYFIAGSDLLKDLDKWKYSDKIREEVKFLIFVRMGYKLERRLLPKQYIIEYTSFVASSSTEIRKRVQDVRKYGRVRVELSEEDIHIKKIRQEQIKEHERVREIAKKLQDGKDSRISVHVDEKNHELDVFQVEKVCSDGKGEEDCKVIEVAKLATIPCDENCQKRMKLQEKYLGIYGIVPNVIIQYIKDHNLYDD